MPAYRYIQTTFIGVNYNLSEDESCHAFNSMYVAFRDRVCEDESCSSCTGQLDDV